MLGRNRKIQRPSVRQPDLTSSRSVLWLMGPTSAGKTTLATQAVSLLRQNAVPAIYYDGDEVRAFFGSDFGFNAEDRLRVVVALVHLANKAAHAGLQVIVAALTAGVDARAYVRDNVENLKIGYVSCSIDVCAQRDPKGLYKKAFSGEIDTLVGYNTEYRPPHRPDLILDTEMCTIDELVSQIAAALTNNQPDPSEFHD